MKPRLLGTMRPFSEYEIDLYMVGDAPLELAQRVDAHVASDPRFAALIAEQRAEQEAFYFIKPRLPEATRLESGAKALWLLGALGGLAVASVLLLMVVPAGDQGAPRSIRTRGGLKTILTVKRGERVFPYGGRARLRAGDQIRVSVEAPAAGFLSVVGRETGHAWSIHYDAVPTRAGSFTAPGSRTMDSSLADETWYVVLTPDPLSAQEIIKRLKAGDTIPGDSSTLTIRKDPVP